MNRPGVLLDTGPIVALLSKNDRHHARAAAAFAACAPPFRTCEAVVAEACFLMRRASRTGPAEVVRLATRGVFEIALSAGDELSALATLFERYTDRPISFADACLIRCAELHEEPRILTFDDDFDVYRWDRRRKFERL